jgi:hypothetical protein
MRNFRILYISLFVSFLPSHAGSQLPAKTVFPLQEVVPYQVGEKLSYRIHYGVINAGEATLEVKEKVRKNDAPTYHMVGTGKSVGMAEWFFKTRDRYETFIDEKKLVPVKFIRDVNEGGYIIKRNIDFDRKNNTAKDHLLKKDTIFSLPHDIQDILSTFYFARCLDVSDIKKGDIIEIPTFLDHEIYRFRIRFIAKEVVKTDLGYINALKFVPIVQEGRVFKDEDDLMIWISDDKNHIPVRIQSELLVGSIKVDLTSCEGLKYKAAFRN